MKKKRLWIWLVAIVAVVSLGSFIGAKSNAVAPQSSDESAICADCPGHAAHHDANSIPDASDKCKSCGGTGKCYAASGMGGNAYCNGTGKCGSCGGNGRLNGTSRTQACPNCQVPGHDDGNKIDRLGNGKCKICKGTGKCQKCNGTGAR